MLVKLFDKHLNSEYGPTDYKSGELHSFERLVDADQVPEGAGFLTNNRVVLGEEILHFKNGAIEWVHPDYQSNAIQEFFLTMRRIYREQLRTMCLLKEIK